MKSPQSPVKVNIRTARRADVERLLAIENTAFAANRLSARSFRRLIGRRTADVLVAECGEAIAGYALVLFRARSSSARLYSIAVAPEFAGCGIGKRLLADAESAAMRRGCSVLRLEVDERNRRALMIYDWAGYAEASRVSDYYEDGGAALRLHKKLASPAQPTPRHISNKAR
jgi:ribosomal protein S18 acetylase RimI-like enzyme